MTENLRSLAESYVSGNLTDFQLTDLENQLRDSESARLEFLACLEVHAGLAWESRGGSEAKENPAAKKILPFRKAALLKIAAAIALLATLAIFFLPARDGTIATVTASLHGQWANGGEVEPGISLKAGTFSLQSGLVELDTGTGTTLLLEGPASLQLNDKLHARLISGNLVVRMPKGKSGFVVDTPRMKVTDLGTEFGVSVSSNGISHVQVYDGKVRAESGGHSGQYLHAGQTLLCTTDGSMLPGKFSEDRFIRTFPIPESNTQAGGPLYNKSTLASLDAHPAPASVITDGDLTEWQHAAPFKAACEPPYDTTYFIEGRMMYDAENLYLAARVADPIPMKNSVRAGTEFAGGSVIVRLSTDRALGWPLKGSYRNARSKSPLPDSTSDRITSIVMWHDARSGRPQIQLLHGFDSHGTRIDPPGWSGAFRKNPDGLGYTLEYRIPWSLLNCAENPPRPGDQLAGLWMTHWSDEQGRVCRGQLVDLTNPDPAATAGIPPYVFFQNGPTWGKIHYLPR